MELPPGFRFHPTDEELITHYLSHKIADKSFISAVIREFDLNKCEPWDLPLEAKMGDEWYFYCIKDRKYPTGIRTNRATDSGYWKATGKDKEIHKRKVLIGMKKTLVFYRGRAPKGKKTNWVMHEYRMEGKHTENQNEWVICRVFYRNSAQKDMEFIKLRSWFDDNDVSLHRVASTDNQHKNKASCAFDMKHVTCFSDTQVIENGYKELLATSYNNPIGISSLNSSVSGYRQTLQIPAELTSLQEDATDMTNFVETNSDNIKLLYKPENDLFSILNFQSENLPCLRTSHINKDFMYYQSS